MRIQYHTAVDNRWRTALFGIWIILLLAAGLLAGGGFWLQARASLNDDALMGARAAMLLGIATACAYGFAVFITLWIVVSAVVLEHEKDRQERRRQLG